MRWFFRPRATAKPAPVKPSRRLRIEPLEDRLTPTASLDVWTDRYDREDQEINGGMGYSDQKDSAKLGWSESYILSSYLSMYQATGDIRYLQKFVDHSDRVIDNASDPDGDGFLGWSTNRYAVSLIRNPGFEYPNPYDITLPIGWSRFQSTARTAYRDWRNDRGGAFGLTLRTDPSNGWQGLQQDLYNPAVRDNRRYEPDTLYQLSFNGKTNGSAAGGRAEVYDFTTNERLAMVRFRNTSWQAHAITFRTPSQGGHHLVVRLMHINYKVKGGTVSFDLVRVRQFSEYLVHDGMITAPMAEFAALVRKDPNLNETLGDKADRYVDFIRNEIIPKWEQFYRPIGTQGGTYVFPDDGSSVMPRQSLPHNQYLALGQSIVWLSQAEDDPVLEERAMKLGTTFKRHLHAGAGGGYTWRYSNRLLSGDHRNFRVAEDVSHANIAIGFAVAAHESGLLFEASDLSRFSRTLTNVMWNHSMRFPGVALRVDGTGGYSRSWLLSGWADLEEYDPRDRTRKVVDAVLSHRSRWNRSGPSGLLTIARLAEAAAGVDNSRR